MKLILSDRQIDIPPGFTIAKAMKSSGLKADAYVYVVNNTPVPMDSVPETDVSAIRVASGG